MTSSARKIFAITNAKAGSASLQTDSLTHLEQVCPNCIRSVREPGDIERVLRDASRERVERIIIIGGDGTVARVINALADQLGEFELAIVPAGTGNDMARSLGLPLDDPLLAAQLACEGQAVPIDLVKLYDNEASTICINAATGGLGGAVAAETDSDQKSQWGKIAYWLTALSKLQEPPQYELEVVSGGSVTTAQVLGVWISNGRQIGGGFTVAPLALIDDGLIDLTIVPALPIFELLSEGVNFALGGPELTEQLIHIQTKSLTLRSTPPLPWSIDGEPSESSWLSCEVLPSAIRIVTGGVNPALVSVATPAR